MTYVFACSKEEAAEAAIEKMADKWLRHHQNMWTAWEVVEGPEIG
jgi:hypothetical protein